jgi:hypothetical protein
MDKRHFRSPLEKSSLAPPALLAELERRTPTGSEHRRRRLALARRDLQADWRRWSPAERSTVVAALAGLALTPILVLSGIFAG